MSQPKEKLRSDTIARRQKKSELRSRPWSRRERTARLLRCGSPQRSVPKPNQERVKIGLGGDPNAVTNVVTRCRPR